MDSKISFAILLCTFNGESFLKEQLDSIFSQTLSDWHLWVSDDGSIDGTLQILESYKKKYLNRLTIFNGPKKGFAKNFLSLVCNPSIKAEYYAYCDQDDIWYADKLASAKACLEQFPETTPAVYGARALLIDAAGIPFGETHKYLKPFNFKNALMQGVASGNTMVFNDSASLLLRKSGADIDINFHDWWTYILISACNGRIFIEDRLVLKYRQHSASLIGYRYNLRDKWIRIKSLLSGNTRSQNTQHINALEKMAFYLTPENRYILKLFKESRDKPLILRLVGLIRTGIYRQNFYSDIALTVAAFLKKL